MYVRLDKYICESTSVTRNVAKKMLRDGQITCDGIMVKDGKFQVAAPMEVALNGEPISPIGFRYIMLNKPKNIICSTQDEVYPCVLSLLDIEKPNVLHSAGRLDADTTGLVLITDDGNWSHLITSPKKDCGKRYRVGLEKPIDSALIETFSKGIQLRNESGLTKPAKLELISTTEVLLTITEGKYHQVKRMFAAVGNKVLSLHRESIGKITLDLNLSLGEWRYLSNDEIKSVS